MIFWATSLLQERANWTWWSFELLLYFRDMPTGIHDLWSYFSETCQLDFMIFWATSLLQERANWTWWSFEPLLYFRNVPTGLNDLSVKVCNSEFLHETFDNVFINIFIDILIYIYIYIYIIFIHNICDYTCVYLMYTSFSPCCPSIIIMFIASSNPGMLRCRPPWLQNASFEALGPGTCHVFAGSWNGNSKITGKSVNMKYWGINGY